jgi:hypothetical protein
MRSEHTDGSSDNFPGLLRNVRPPCVGIDARLGAVTAPGYAGNMQARAAPPRCATLDGILDLEVGAQRLLHVQ